MEIDNKELVEGKFYLWKVATQQGTGIHLHSVYFVTDKKDSEGKPDIYEVVFTKPGEGGTSNGWYLVKKDIALKQNEVIEAEVVEEKPKTESAAPNTLEIQVEDELQLGEIIGGE